MLGSVLMGSCHETARRMSAYAEGELRGVRRWRVSGHLSRCERCRAIFHALLATIELLRSAGQLEPAARPELADRVVARIRREGGPG